jgi:hypothetical protein
MKKLAAGVGLFLRRAAIKAVLDSGLGEEIKEFD